LPRRHFDADRLKPAHLFGGRILGSDDDLKTSWGRFERQRSGALALAIELDRVLVGASFRVKGNDLDGAIGFEVCDL